MLQGLMLPKSGIVTLLRGGPHDSSSRENLRPRMPARIEQHTEIGPTTPPRIPPGKPQENQLRGRGGRCSASIENRPTAPTDGSAVAIATAHTRPERCQLLPHKTRSASGSMLLEFA